MNNYDTNSFKRADTKRGWDSDRKKIGEAPAEPKGKSKKDTRKWCKGVVGREHKWYWVYSQILWNHNRGKEFVEPPLPPENAPERDSRDFRLSMNCLATKYCAVCQKQICYGDSMKLRCQGITILTKLPE